ncbi:zinc finger protein ZAT4-like [Impatiens glandulifera]|uniref:zinc finger protein ZAT4-like n=1 Tax=Impatiens glandulifera TaxID=253017 RepID=UPI001FB165B8|nr:zinc finger protein ZAT4-like [Impatiens glandulifera]
MEDSGGQEKSIELEAGGSGYDGESLRNMMSCETCGKSFSSPKALGGHMRVHVKVNNNTKKLMNRSPVGPGNADEELETKPICFVCGKNFPSMKSLFGHMRCHPERQYRGIKPPAENMNIKIKNTMTTDHSSSSSFDETGYSDEKVLINCNVDQHESHDLIMLSVLRWPVTGKRGRKFLSSPQTTTMEEEEEEEVNVEDENKLLEAVEVLLTLANSDPFLISEVTNSNSLTINNTIQSTSDDHHEEKDDVGGFHEKLLVSSPEIGSKSFTKEDDYQSEIRVPIDQEQVMITQQRKRLSKKKRKLMELDDINVPPITYKQHINHDSMEILRADDHHQKCFKCSDCNKIFSTHQALGGHKSGHNKHMIKIQNQTNCDDLITMNTGDNNNKESGGKIQVVQTTTTSTSSSPHQCKRCGKIFPTGQALGGHMRSHYIGNLTEELYNSSTEANFHGQIVRKIHAFDLNQLPPNDDQENMIN